MKQDKYISMFNDFRKRYPEIAKNAMYCTQLSNEEIMVVMKDDSAVLYDNLFKTITTSRDALDLREKRYPKEASAWRKQFAIQLDRLLILKGYSQEELADIVEISQSTISNYIAGKTIPTVDILIQIALAMECNREELCDLLSYQGK